MYIPLVRKEDGQPGVNVDMFDALGLSTDYQRPDYPSTFVGGSLCVQPGPKPTDPIVGTLIMDSEDNNHMKWWNGVQWMKVGVVN